MIWWNKNVIIGIVVIVIAIALGVGGYFLLSDWNENTNVDDNNNASDNDNNNTDTGSTENILVVYFSATGNTEAVAESIAENLGADIFKIVPSDPYTSNDLNYTDDDSRVSREYADESLRDVELESTTIENWEDYDTVIIGYPIRWGIAAWPVSSFVAANDFTGKTVIPFCTSSSSSLGQSGELLSDAAGTGAWLEGIRFRSRPSDADIREFTDSIN